MKIYKPDTVQSALMEKCVCIENECRYCWFRLTRNSGFVWEENLWSKITDFRLLGLGKLKTLMRDLI